MVGFLSVALLLAATLVNHRVWMRALAGAAFLTEALFLMSGGSRPLWLSLACCGLLVGANVLQLLLAYREKVRAKLTTEERALREWLFPTMGDADFHRLLKVGKRSEIMAGTFLATQGEKLEQLHFITNGAAHVIANGMVVATLREGSLVGEVSFFRDDVATASVVAQGNLKVLSIGRQELRKLMRSRESLQRALHESIGRDLGFKLTTFDESRF